LTAGPLAALCQARGSDLWLDGGHNPHAGRALAETVGRLAARDGRPVALVVAMYDRKDAQGFFAPFANLKPQVVTTTFDSPNAAGADALAQAAQAAGLAASAAPDVTAAVRAVLAGEGPAPHVLICGGLHFAGEVLGMSPETWPT
jgi:dihydrofolate synthase/folylpolyglutamate synthase